MSFSPLQSVDVHFLSSRCHRGGTPAALVHRQQRDPADLPEQLLREMAEHVPGPGSVEVRVPVLQPVPVRSAALLLSIVRVRRICGSQKGGHCARIRNIYRVLAARRHLLGHHLRYFGTSRPR